MEFLLWPILIVVTYVITIVYDGLRLHHRLKKAKTAADLQQQ